MNSQWENIIIHEVGMRDGLQMESELVPFDIKEMLLEWLIASGVDIIQVGSFVHPKLVMQMADTDELFKSVRDSGIKTDNVTLSALVLNRKGLERGLKVDVEMFCMGVSASETHSKKNTGKTTEEALDDIIPMALDALAEGKKVQVSVQSAFGCGYEGKIDENKVYAIVEKYLEAGLKNISLADTAGKARPEQVERMYSKIFSMDNTIEAACHFHDTYGYGMANIEAAVNTGVKYIETAFGGLGGCPFTKSPSGNVPTEDFVYELQKKGYRKDIDNGKIIKAANYMANFLVRELPGKIYKQSLV
jgi:hydroxymethylglutaryl-CoA lyase